VAAFLPVISPEKHLAYAVGYLDLGLHAEARAELAALPREVLGTPAALALNMEISMAESKWDEVLALAEALVGNDAKQERPWVAWAYALRELDRTQEAQEILLAGRRMIARPSVLVDYNLACYACLLGELEEARALLTEVFARDKSWREMAKEDPDLAALFPQKPKPEKQKPRPADGA
jgi:predicted Zn-dependent protease